MIEPIGPLTLEPQAPTGLVAATPAAERPASAPTGPSGPAVPWRWPVLVVMAVVAATAAPVLSQRALWFDEAFSWQLTRFSWAEMLDRAARDVHPPLYYLFLKAWTSLLGDGPLAMRSMSVAWFAAALAAGAATVREAARARNDEPSRAADAGWIAVLLLGSSPFLLRYAVEARMYTQLIALLFLTLYTLLKATARVRGDSPAWVGYAIAGAAAAYTHYLAIFALAAQAAYVVGLAFVRAEGRTGVLARSPLLRRAALSYAAMAMLYLPWVPILLRQQAQVAEDYWAPAIHEQSPLQFPLWRQMALRCVLHDRAQLAPQYPPDAVVPQAISYGLLAGLAAILAMLSRQGRGGWLLLCAIALPIDLTLINCYRVERNLIEHRYLICSFAATLLGLALLLGAIRGRSTRWTLAYLASINLLYCDWNLASSADIPARPEARGVADAIAQGWKPGDLAVCREPVDYFPMKYHARGRFDVRQIRDDDLVINHYNGGPILDDRDMVDSLDGVARDGGRIWLVTRASHGNVPPAPGLTLSATTRFDETIAWRGQLVLSLWRRTEQEPQDIAARRPH